MHDMSALQKRFGDFFKILFTIVHTMFIVLPPDEQMVYFQEGRENQAMERADT